jgi:hypothetical protein
MFLTMGFFVRGWVGGWAVSEEWVDGWAESEEWVDRRAVKPKV